jgi:hypothetical protein
VHGNDGDDVLQAGDWNADDLIMKGNNGEDTIVGGY